ncbi:hypothetical protein [Halorarius halobius]|uniref:hypothetical protein n=1 Tax=Halorarius halobius TaxID=2962671 RepID=UPI0020CB9412|nr:hypothetical protein [Halorarius halobius]
MRLPTRRRDWRLMARTARLVVSVPRYAALSAVAAVAALSLFVFSLNLPLFGYALSADLALIQRVELLVVQFPFVGPAFDPLQGLLLVGVAALTGVDVAMAVYHFREHGVSVRQGGTGAAGVLLGTLGAGCAACGSAILVGLLSLLGVSTSLLWLPLDGLEFALGAVVVLLLSVFWLADGMRGGEVNGCPVEP